MHYDTISALHKSVRGSDVQASLYWAARMLRGGDDPRYVCRRLVRMASEDIGLADPMAMSVAVAAYAHLVVNGLCLKYRFELKRERDCSQKLNHFVRLII